MGGARRQVKIRKAVVNRCFKCDFISGVFGSLAVVELRFLPSPGSADHLYH